MRKLLILTLSLFVLSAQTYAQVAPPVVEDHLLGEYLRIPTTHSSVSAKYTGPTVHYLSTGSTIQLSSLWAVKPNRPGTLSTITRYYKLSRHGVSSSLIATVNGATTTPPLLVEAGIYTYRMTRQFIYSNPNVVRDFDTVFYKDFTITVKPNKSAWAYAGNDTLIFQDMESRYMIGGAWVATPAQKVVLSAKGSTGGTSWAWSKTKAPAGDRSVILNPAAEVTEVSGIRAGDYEFTLTMNGTMVDRMNVTYKNKKYEYMASGCRTGTPVVHVLPPTKAPTLGANGQYYANWNYPFVAKYIFDNTGKTLMGGDHIVLNAERAPGVAIDSVTRVWLDGFGGRKECPVIVRTETKTPIVMKGDGSTMVFGGGDQLKSSCIYFTVDGTYWRSSGTPYGFRFDNRNRMRQTVSPTQITPLSFDFASSFTFRGFRSIGGGSIKMKMEAHMRAPRQLRFFSYDSIVLSDIWQSRVNNEGYYVLSTASEGTKSDEQYSTPPRGKHIQLKNILIDSTLWDGLQITNCHKDALVENVFAWRTGKEDQYGQNLAINFGGTIQGKVINNVIKDSHGKGINAHTNDLDNIASEISGNVIDSVGYSLYKGTFESDPLMVTGSHSYPEYIRWGRVNVRNNVVTMRSDTRSAISLGYMNGIGLSGTSTVNDNIFVHPDAVRLNRYAPGKGVVAVGFNDKITTPHTGNYGTFNRTFKWTVIGVEETASGYKIKGTINGVYKEWTSIADMNTELKKAAGVGGNTPPVIEVLPEIVLTLPTNQTTVIPTVTDADNNALTYQWTKQSVLAASLTAPTTGKNLGLTSLAEGVHSFKLLASDGKDTAGQIFIVRVLSNDVRSNLPPFASAGNNMSVSGSDVSLAGSGTDPEGGTLTYKWSQLDGPQGAVISDTTAASTSITMLSEGTYNFEFKVMDDKGAEARDTVTVDVAVPTFFTSKKIIKVNIYGGTNPFSHAEWNNWNAGQHLTSGSFFFSNNSASPISATLSSSLGIKDNGSIYGEGMAPAPVLRYSSYATAARTLTLSGLTPSKYYDLVLFASRNASPGQHTLININKAEELVAPYKNLDKTVHYSHLLPDPTGKLVISIQSANQYNYLNGFILTELTNAPSNEVPVANAGNDITLPHLASSSLLSGSGIDKNGSIQKYAWSKVTGPSAVLFSDRTIATPMITNLSEGTYTFRLTVADDEGAHSYDDVQVTVQGLVSTDQSKLLKVNLCSTNGYNNPEWNNWNINTSLSRSGLRYADSSVSGISLVLSKSEQVRDNGATYGGGMAPEDVLRTTSYSTTARTLTFSGLSTTKSYALELYASRANTGNSTKFTINGKAVTVCTDNNKTDKAVFTSLTPTAGGQIVISVASVNTFNYLNGLILIEGASAAPLPVAAGQAAFGTAETPAPVLSSAAASQVPGALEVANLKLQVAPNPSSIHFTLTIKTAGPEPMMLRVWDALGREVESKRLPGQSATLRLGSQWKVGTYYAEVMQGRKKAMIKLLKTT